MFFIEQVVTKTVEIDMSDMENMEVKRVHAICSWIKGRSSDQVMVNLVKMRDLCGGHGYSVYSQYPRLIKDMLI